MKPELKTRSLPSIKLSGVRVTFLFCVGEHPRLCSALPGSNILSRMGQTCALLPKSPRTLWTLAVYAAVLGWAGPRTGRLAPVHAWTERLFWAEAQEGS